MLRLDPLPLCIQVLEVDISDPSEETCGNDDNVVLEAEGRFGAKGYFTVTTGHEWKTETTTGELGSCGSETCRGNVRQEKYLGQRCQLINAADPVSPFAPATEFTAAAYFCDTSSFWPIHPQEIVGIQTDSFMATPQSASLEPAPNRREAGNGSSMDAMTKSKSVTIDGFEISSPNEDHADGGLLMKLFNECGEGMEDSQHMVWAKLTLIPKRIEDKAISSGPAATFCSEVGGQKRSLDDDTEAEALQIKQQRRCLDKPLPMSYSFGPASATAESCVDKDLLEFFHVLREEGDIDDMRSIHLPDRISEHGTRSMNEVDIIKEQDSIKSDRLLDKIAPWTLSGGMQPKLREPDEIMDWHEVSDTSPSPEKVVLRMSMHLVDTYYNHPLPMQILGDACHLMNELQSDEGVDFDCSGEWQL